MITVYCDIVGDLFHYGHMNFLMEAKKLGDFLIVGLVADEVVEQYKRKPIMALHERQKMVEGCKYVDLVVPNCPCPITKNFIHKHKIDYVLHGDDFTDEDLDKWYKVPKMLNKLKILPYTKGISTSEIIERIITRHLSTNKV